MAKQKQAIVISGALAEGLREGETLLDPQKKKKPSYITVENIDSQYIPEDGMSFGLMSDSGYLNMAYCRKATREEIMQLSSARLGQYLKSGRENLLRQVWDEVKSRGERPEQCSVEGIEIPVNAVPFGNCDYLVLGKEYIYHQKFNGRDGDDWSFNNCDDQWIVFRLPADPLLVEQIKLLTAGTECDLTK